MLSNNLRSEQWRPPWGCVKRVSHTQREFLEVSAVLVWLCAGATIFDVFHRLFEFSFGELKFSTVCVRFQSVNRGVAVRLSLRLVNPKFLVEK